MTTKINQIILLTLLNLAKNSRIVITSSRQISVKFLPKIKIVKTILIIFLSQTKNLMYNSWFQWTDLHPTKWWHCLNKTILMEKVLTNMKNMNKLILNIKNNRNFYFYPQISSYFKMNKIMWGFINTQSIRIKLSINVN